MTVSSQGIEGRRSSPQVKASIDHDRLGHAARIVAPIERKIGARAAGAIAEMRVAPDQASGETFGVGIDQELVGVEAEAAFRLIGSVHPIAVELARHDVAEIAMPDVLAALRQRDPLELAPALAVEQAKLDLLRIGGEQREVGAAPVPSGAQRMRGTRAIAAC